TNAMPDDRDAIVRHVGNEARALHGRASGRGGELALHELVDRREVRHRAQLVLGDRELEGALDLRDDLDRHHRVDPEILEGRLVRDLVDLAHLGDDRAQLLPELGDVHALLPSSLDPSDHLATTRFSTRSKSCRTVWMPT